VSLNCRKKYDQRAWLRLKRWRSWSTKRLYMADVSSIVAKLSSVWNEHVKPGEGSGIVVIDASHIREVCAFLQRDPDCYFDMLSCLTGIDNGPEAGTMEVVYNLYSIPFDHH